MSEELELLDTPGVMLPRIPDEETALKLGALSVIKGSLLDFTMIFGYLVSRLDWIGRGVLAARYGIDEATPEPGNLLSQIGRSRGILRAGGEVDLDKTAIHVIKEYRDGILGRFSLESPDGVSG